MTIQSTTHVLPQSQSPSQSPFTSLGQSLKDWTRSPTRECPDQPTSHIPSPCRRTESYRFLILLTQACPDSTATTLVIQEHNCFIYQQAQLCIYCNARLNVYNRGTASSHFEARQVMKSNKRASTPPTLLTFSAVVLWPELQFQALAQEWS